MKNLSYITLAGALIILSSSCIGGTWNISEENIAGRPNHDLYELRKFYIWDSEDPSKAGPYFGSGGQIILERIDAELDRRKSPSVPYCGYVSPIDRNK